MASPVVAGMAALLMSYFPDLTAQQIKSVIEKSATRITTMDVKKPGTDDEVKMSDLCTSGGIINAYAAVKLADSMSTKTTEPKTVLPKAKMKKAKKG